MSLYPARILSTEIEFSEKKYMHTCYKHWVIISQKSISSLGSLTYKKGLRENTIQYRQTAMLLSYYAGKELGFFHIIFAQILTAHNIRLTHARPSILIYANALGYILSIKVEFVMQNMMSICLCCCIWEGGLKSTASRKLIKTNNTAYF